MRLSSFFLLTFWLMFSAALNAQAEPALFNAEGYRVEHYRSPTPEQLDGVQTLDTAGLKQLLSNKPDTVLIDVLRRSWVHGQFINEEAHRNIPHSLWLANTGEGELTAQWQHYFRHYLEQATRGNKTHPLVVYCKADCWLSWNASRRAHAWGYQQVYWYREGIDGWQNAELPTELATPEPVLSDNQK